MYALNKYQSNDAAESEFYYGLLSSFGLPNNSVTVSRFVQNGEFTVSSPDGTITDGYLDVGNPLKLVNPVTNPPKSLYHGTLLHRVEMTTLAGGTPTLRAYLFGGAGGNAFKLIPGISPAATFTGGQKNDLLDVAFTLLHGRAQNSGAFQTDITVYWHFVGKKIDFQ